MIRKSSKKLICQLTVLIRLSMQEQQFQLNSQVMNIIKQLIKFRLYLRKNNNFRVVIKTSVCLMLWLNWIIYKKALNHKKCSLLLIFNNPYILFTYQTQPINSLMLNAKRPDSIKTPKNTSSSRQTPFKPKKPKEPSQQKTSRPAQIISHTILTIHTRNTDCLKTLRMPTAVTCPNKEQNKYNPYFELGQKEERVCLNSQSRLIKGKNLERGKEVNKQKENKRGKQKKNTRKKEISKDMTFSPDQINRKLIKKRQRMSRSVDLLKKFPNKIGNNTSHHQSRSQSVVLQKHENKRKDLVRTEIDENRNRNERKITTDTSLMRNKTDTPISRRNFERQRSKSARLFGQKIKPKSIQKSKINDFGPALQQVEQLKQQTQIQVVLKDQISDSRVILQKPSESSSDQSLAIDELTLEEQEQYLKLVKNAQEVCKNSRNNEEELLRQVCNILTKAFKINIMRQHASLNTFQTKQVSSIADSTIKTQQEIKQSSSLKFHTFSLKLPDIHSQSQNPSNEDSIYYQQIKEPKVKMPTLELLQIEHHSFQTVLSPKSWYINKIENVIDEKSRVSYAKYLKRMDIVYGLLNQQLYSPKTFQNKVEFVESVQHKEYKEFDKQLQAALRIKALLISMQKDKEQLKELEEAYQEENWEKAMDLMRIEGREEREDSVRMQQLQHKIYNYQDLAKSNNRANEDILEKVENVELKRISHYQVKTNQGQSKSMQETILVPFQSSPEIIRQPSLNQLKKQQQNNNHSFDLSQVSVVREYCKNVFQLIKASPTLFDSFARNLITPIQYNFVDLLKSYHQSIKRDFKSSLPYYYYWKQYLNVEKVISESSIEIIFSKINYNIGINALSREVSLIHQRMILDALNESLDYQRPNYRIVNIPWSIAHSSSNKQDEITQLHFQNNQFSIDKIATMFNSAQKRLLVWARQYCGIMLDSLSGNQKDKIGESFAPSQQGSKQQILREVRMAMMFHDFLQEYEVEIGDFSYVLTEVKLRLEEEVMKYIVIEALEEIVSVLEGEELF